MKKYSVWSILVDKGEKVNVIVLELNPSSVPEEGLSKTIADWIP